MNKLEYQEFELLKQQTKLVMANSNRKNKMTRQEANKKILEKISKVIEAEPDWRFHQILQNIGIEVRGADQWYDESEDTLSAIKMPSFIVD